MTTAHHVDSLIERQLEQWRLARDNYAALEALALRAVSLEGSEVVVQYNPERRRSNTAPVDDASIAARPCFLCREHQPTEQEYVEWRGEYKIQVNPYPIFPRHLTIASLAHTPQTLFPPKRIDHMLALAEELPDWVLFYNGPRCGASAPDHFHFQAACAVYMPLPDEVLNPTLWRDEAIIENVDNGFIGFTRRLGRPLFLIRAERRELAAFYLARLQLAMRLTLNHTPEPRQNLLCWAANDYFNIVVFPRAKHRPDCYGDTDRQFLLSPAATEMAGLWTVCRPSDFDRLDNTTIQTLYNELCTDNTTIVAILENFAKT